MKTPGSVAPRMDPAPPVRPRERALVFAALIALSTVQNYLWTRGALQGHTWAVSLERGLAWAVPWYFVSPLVWWLAARARRRSLGVGALAIWHLGGVLLCFAPIFALSQLIEVAGDSARLGWSAARLELLVPSSGDVLSSLLQVPFMYAAVAAAGSALVHARAARERELQAARLTGQLSDARLALLQRQLHPHFLFNALQAVSTLLYRDPALADGLLVRLSELLRRLLDEAASPEVSARAELAFTRRYLQIEQVRFQDRLTVDWRVEVPDAALDTPVPSLVLLPLVDNALRHGLSAKVGRGRLEIAVVLEGGCLALSVRDDGVGAPSPVRRGIGLGNTAQRLDTLYGSAAALEASAPAGGGFLASVRVPLLREAGAR